MAIEAELFDGTILEFPDETSDDIIQAAVQKQTKIQQGPSVLETVASLPERAWKGTVSGVTTTRAAFADRQAVVDPEQLETYKMYPESPAAKAYFGERGEADQAIREHKLMKGELEAARPLGAENSLFDKVVGGAAESAGASLIPTLALGAINPALGMAAGLGTNFAMEAGGQWDEARTKGATDEQIGRSMGFGGAVSTMLELPVLSQVKRMMQGGGKTLGKEMLKLGGKEWAQEQATQHAMDIEANVSGWGDYTAGDIMERGLVAGASGALLGAGMGGGAKLVGMAKEKNAEVIQTKAITRVLAENAGLTDPAEIAALEGRVMENIRTLKVDPDLAEEQRAALAGKFQNVPNTDYGNDLGQRMDTASWSKVGEDLDVGGVSESVDERRNRYLEMGLQDTTPHAERIIMAQTNPEAEGLKVGQVATLPDGSVTVVGGSALSQTSLFPGMLPSALRQTVQTIADTVGITAPIILTMEQMPDDKMGRYSRLGLPDGRYAHVINPRELPSWKYGGNQTTQAEFVYALTHEIGHALKVERLKTGVLEKAAAAGISNEVAEMGYESLMREVANFQVSPETLQQVAAIAPTEAALISQWNDIQTKFRADTRPGSGKELATAWFGPRKFAWGVGKTTSAQDIWDWLRQQEKRVAKAEGRQERNIDLLTGVEVAELVTGSADYFFSFDEFMAEQFSRASYDRNYLKGTTLGQWFQDVLTKLRAFFGQLKDQGFVKPQETFEQWLDEQTARGKAMKKGRSRTWGKVKLSKEMKAAQKIQLAQLNAEREALAAEGELEVAEDEHPLPEDERVEVEDSITREQVEELLEIQREDMSGKDIAAVTRLIAKGNYIEAMQRLDDAGTTYDDRTYTSQAIKEFPNKEMLQSATIKGIMGQQKLKKQDKLALAEVYAKYPTGQVPRQVAVDAILSKNVPLKLEISNTYSDYGVSNIGLPTNEKLQRRNKPAQSESHIWKAPFEISKDNHFSNPNYVAHTRVFVSPTRYAVMELQSDLMQKQTKKDLEKKTQMAHDRLVYARFELERIGKQLGEVMPKQAELQGFQDRGEELPVGESLVLYNQQVENLQAGLKRWELFLKESTTKFNYYSTKLRQGLTEEEKTVIESTGKQNWWQRILKEEMAEAARLGKPTLEFASPDTIAKVEGWRQYRQPGEYTLDIQMPLVIFGRNTGTVPTYKLVRTLHEEEDNNGERIFYHTDMYEASIPTGVVGVYTMEDFMERLEEYLKSIDSPYYGNAFGYLEEKLADVPLYYGPDIQSIYDRYEKEVIPWLQKTWDATFDGQGWWVMDVPKNAEEILLWDKGNPANPTYPQLTNHQLAGIEEVDMTPEEMQKAMDAWDTLGFESPYFKRWWGEGKLVDAITGDPFKVYHGTGSVVRFFDQTLARWEQVFFFSASVKTAKWYADKMMIGYGRRTAIMSNHADQRKAQKLRDRIQVWERNLDERKVKVDPAKARAHLMRMKRALTEMEDTAEWSTPVSTIGEYYVRIENPFEIDFEGDEWSKGAYEQFIQTAKALGHDGMIIKNVKDPLLDTIYITFTPEQIKDSVHQTGAFQEVDLTMWDKQNPVESTLSNLGKVLDKVGEVGVWNSFLNGVKRASDSLVQLQQRAAQPLPDGSMDVPLQHLLKGTLDAEAFKNSLQFKGETLVHSLWNRSPKELDQIYAVMEDEWQSGKLAFALQGLTANPSNPNAEIIWGNLPDGGQDVTAATGKEVNYWDFVPTKATALLLTKHGIDLNTIQGQELLQIITELKTTMLEQFTALENVLRHKILQRYESAPMVAALEIEKLYQVMQKIRQTPFFPQGWYGDWVISIQEKKTNPAKGERKYKLVRVEHYQTKTAMQKALKKWYALKGSGDTLKISYNKREELDGIPMQLPRNLIDQISKTGIFTEEQLQTMEEVMLPVGHEKLGIRYGKWSENLLGGEKDIVKNFSNFIWHNANFVWKLKFRTDFTRALNAQTALWKQAQKLGTKEGMAQADMLHRNKQIMERVEKAVIHPPYEFQGARQAVALLYLAYNAKTALMNASTMLNTYAAITTEYGEILGSKLFAKGLLDASRIYSLHKQQKTGELSAKDSELVWAYDRGVQEGILDQSYAFFLAGQANSHSQFQGMRKGYVAKASYKAQMYGMFPFRMMEKANRTATLIMFFGAERARGADIEIAFQEAVIRTNLLQNAYNQANRSELFRGKKAIFTMFMSYVQFMTWNMYGGYAKALRANLTSRDLKVEHLGKEHAYTVKLLLMYTILGGLLAGPGLDDLMEVISLIWRKLYGTNARLELREFIRELGWDPDLITHGVLSSVAGMDLSGSFSIGRIVPGISLINKSWETPAEFLGAFMTKAAGPFGGFTEDLLKTVVALDGALRGRKRWAEVAKEMPGAIGAAGKAVDAWIVQNLAPTKAVLTKSGARVVEDPPGSGEFRDLTNWEMIGMALGGNPSVLSRNRELNYWQVGEQIYWRTKIQQLLDNHWEAVNTQDVERQDRVAADIEKFNNSLPPEHTTLRITGKMKADSLRTHRKNVMREEQGRARSRRMQSVMDEVQ